MKKINFNTILKIVLISAIISANVVYAENDSRYIPMPFSKPTIEEETVKQLPEISYKEPISSKNGTLFAYSSTPSQTNGNPFITASGKRVADGTVANNCLPFGTVVKFPELFGDKTFIIQDRMAARYGCDKYDIWHASTQQAIQFGKHYSTVEIY